MKEARANGSVSIPTSIDGWEKITFNWKREGKRLSGNVENLDNRFELQWKGEVEVTMWHLSYVCQLWLEICCWRNFSFFFLPVSVESARGLSMSMMCERFTSSSLVESKAKRKEATFSSVIPPSRTHISISLLAWSNKISPLSLLPISAEQEKTIQKSFVEAFSVYS